MEDLILATEQKLPILRLKRHGKRKESKNRLNPISPSFVKGFSRVSDKIAPSGPESRSSLIRSTGIISFFTLLSRISGFIRDMIIAQAFGAGMGADAFFVAQKLPNFLRRLFAEGAFSTAFVPVFADHLAQNDPEGTRNAVRAVFTYLFLVLLLVVGVGEVIMPGIVFVAAPGFIDEPEKFDLAVLLSRVTFPYILFISLAALAAGILNSHRRFAVPASMPILLNLSMITGATLLAGMTDPPTLGLAIGLLVGGCMQLAFQFPSLAKLGLMFRFRWDPRHPSIRRILGLMGPSLLGVSVAQINLLLDLFLASWLPEGSISYLYYADRLLEFPLGLIGVALATAILPTLSARAARGDHAGFQDDLTMALRVIIFLTLPATVGLIVLREPVLALLFERGAFAPATTHLTANALLAYSVGLIALSTVKVTAPAFYAMQDTRTPVRIAIICLAANMIMNIALMFPLQHVGLALATSLGGFLNATLLLRALRRKTGFAIHRDLWMTLIKGAIASGIMGGFLLYARDGWWPQAHTGLAQAVTLAAILTGGMLLYIGAALALGMRETGFLKRIVARKRGG
ncbi:MAG: murein biosynthesis integral membrane protein MurJ [Magnetococcales bacterium]|nr:murein biosynthesis integral membrane protein MurJ [Magnetococcales bacterium]